jgi:hypothetical protein
MRDVNRSRTGGLLLCAVAVCALTFFAGCGDDSPTGAAKAKPQPAKFDAKKLLMQKGEEPGFRPVGPAQVNTAPFPLPPAGAKALRRSGFISSTFQSLESDDAAGAANITLFKTATGAREWMEHETTDKGIKEQIPKPGKIRRFTVSGVPGARGWTALDLHGNKIGQVFWVDGRCEFVIGNEDNPPFVEPLQAGAKAWYGRTKGMCPA